MEARFVVDRAVRRQDRVALAKVMYRKVRIFYGVFALAYWAYALFCFDGGLQGSIVLFVVAALLTLLALFHPQFMAWRIRRAGNKKVQNVSYSFCDEKLYVKTSVDEGTVHYDAFIKIVENKGYYLLFITKYSAHVLPKCDFTQGEPEEFRAFISEKTGLEIKYVR